MTSVQRESGTHEAVQHMKWWGWGLEGVAFDHRDKPRLAPFVLENVEVDLHTPGQPVPRLEDLAVPTSHAAPALVDRLAAAVGSEHVHTDARERVVHTYGKSLRDLLRLRAGSLPRVPDVVVYPADEAQVQAVMDAVLAADAVLIPFGGGSNISGSLEPPPHETRPVVSLDMGRMNRVLELDAVSGLARVQAGTLGPDIEAQLGASGWTLGHFPDSFTHSTLGGWVATRSSGMQSDKYGDIADMVRAVRVVVPGRPGGAAATQAADSSVLVTRPVPSQSTGPSVREMVLGSEGRLGVITEVTVQVHRVPERRVVLGYLFPSWTAGVAAMAELSASDAAPSITRVSDARETAFSFATRRRSTGVSSLVSKALMKVLARRGWDLDQVCLSFVGFEGGEAHVRRQRRLVRAVVRRHGGVVLGRGPGQLYDQKKFDTPYIRDFLLDRGALADVSETATSWAQLPVLYDRTVEAAEKAFASIGVRGWLMCHLSHSYTTGACLYFTFAFRQAGTTAESQYDVVKSAVQQSFMDNGGTLSHHHAVGTEHARWLADDISETGARLLGDLFAAVDPGGNLNPGKIVG